MTEWVLWMTEGLGLGGRSACSRSRRRGLIPPASRWRSPTYCRGRTRSCSSSSEPAYAPSASVGAEVSTRVGRSVCACCGPGIPSLLEAMAADIACVTSPVVGIPEVIGDGVEGWFVPPGLADALVEALGDDGPRASSAPAGPIRVDEGSRSNAPSTGARSRTQGSYRQAEGVGCPSPTEPSTSPTGWSNAPWGEIKHKLGALSSLRHGPGPFSGDNKQGTASQLARWFTG